jgi:hypothetical protein
LGSKEKIACYFNRMLMDEEDVMLKWRIWCRQWLLRREERGAWHTIFRELAIEDTPGFAGCMRMPYAKLVKLAENFRPLQLGKKHV